MPSYFGPDLDRIVRWAKTYVDFRFRTKIGLRCDGEYVKAMVWLPVGNRRPTITIDRSLDLETATDCLLHELAHLTDHIKRGLPDDHDRAHDTQWGSEYSRWYRAFYKWRDNE